LGKLKVVEPFPAPNTVPTTANNVAYVDLDTAAPLQISQFAGGDAVGHNIKPPVGVPLICTKAVVATSVLLSPEVAVGAVDDPSKWTSRNAVFCCVKPAPDAEVPPSVTTVIVSPAGIVTPVPPAVVLPITVELYIVAA
jgi:hypothetical protein